MSRPRKPFLNRLWSMIEKRGADECWPWTAAVNHGGYAMINRGGGAGERVLAHRAAYEITFGPIPDGLCVCHRCDNRRCCNPAHLFAGTHADNSRDMVLKGRSHKPQGEIHPTAKLTSAQAVEIRAAIGTQKQIAAQFGISKSQVGNIRRLEHWAHI